MFINCPHFMYSYLLLYSGYREKIGSHAILKSQRRRYVWAGIITPITLLVFLAVAIWQQKHGWLTYFVELYLITVGWHYTKQGFGMLVHLSAMKGVIFTLKERRFFLINAYFSWFASWLLTTSEPFFMLLHGQDSMMRYVFGIRILLLPIPLAVTWASLIALGLSALTTFIVLWRKTGRSAFPINGTTGYVAALYLRLPMFAIHPLFAVCIPALHSLQYLIFVWRYKAGEHAYQRAQATPNNQFANFAFSGVVQGLLWFFLVPMILQLFTPVDTALYGPMFFMLIFTLSINIHHFFIDNVIWRKENEDVKRYLRQPLI